MAFFSRFIILFACTYVTVYRRPLYAGTMCCSEDDWQDGTIQEECSIQYSVSTYLHTLSTVSTLSTHQHPTFSPDCVPDKLSIVDTYKYKYKYLQQCRARRQPPAAKLQETSLNRMLELSPQLSPASTAQPMAQPILGTLPSTEPLPGA